MHDETLVQRALELLAKPIKPVKEKEALRPQPALDPIPPLQPTWRELAHMTAGLEHDDPRLGPVLEALTQGAKAQDAGDAPGFEHAAERVKRLMHFVPGALVQWRGSEGHHLAVLGPATVEHVDCDQGQLWVWTAWKGQGRWVPERSIIAMGQIEAPALSTHVPPTREGKL